MNAFPPAVRRFGEVMQEARTADRPVARVRVRPEPRRTVVRLWLPLTPLLVLLAPIPILLIPLLYLAPPLRGMNCAAAVFRLGDTLLALSGTDIDVDTADALVRIRIF
ncbi:MAG: hypothetical protein ACREE0_22290 [Phenylobacterium sp.]